jgi:YVTN family beta-propeller protein
MKVSFRLLLSALLLSAFSLFIFSCKKDPKVVKTRYENGIFIVNEGSNGSGTLTFYNPDSSIVVQDVFGTENNDASLGKYFQSIAFHNNKAYCVVSGANRVVVLDAKTMKYQDSIGGLEFPRYFLGLSNTKAYISQWGSDGVSGSIKVIDLVTNKVVKTITVGVGTDRMIKSPNQNRVFVVNENGYGFSNQVSEIDTETDEVITNFTVGYGPNSLVWKSATQRPMILCGGKWDDEADPGRLSLIRDTDALKIRETNHNSKDLCVNSDETLYYYTDGDSVFEKDDEPDIAPKKLFDQACYGLFFDKKNELLYCLDAKDYVSEGELVVRKLDGTIVKTITTGVAPGEVVFR